MKKLVRWIEGIFKIILKSIYKLLGKELTEEQWTV